MLRTNDWMDTHAFPEGVKVQSVCLTLVGEARLWYYSLRPINIDCFGLKISLDNNIQRWVIQQNNYFTYGDVFISMITKKH